MKKIMSCMSKSYSQVLSTFCWEFIKNFIPNVRTRILDIGKYDEYLKGDETISSLRLSIVLYPPIR
jgi:hypothetical protein